MIGRVKRIRAAPGKRMPPRTSGKAAIVPIVVAIRATTTATTTELKRAEWIALSASIFSYQWSVMPVIGKPGVSAGSIENSTRNTIGR